MKNGSSKRVFKELLKKEFDRVVFVNEVLGWLVGWTWFEVFWVLFCAS